MPRCGRRLLVAFVLTIALGCSEDSGPPVGPAEVVSTPFAPAGDPTVSVGDSAVYTTGGATSNVGSTVEYRFDFDAAGGHDYTPWSTDPQVTRHWQMPGVFEARAEARSTSDPSVTSNPSPATMVQVGVDPDTEILRVWSDAGSGLEAVNFADGIPDTLPYNSDVWVVYRGTDASFDPINCADSINKCFRYQVSYARDSDRAPNFFFRSPWEPGDPVDNNPQGTVDSTRFSVGSVDYELNARAVGPTDIGDPTPPAVFIIGNFPPTLDSFEITDQSNNTVSDGDTIVFNFWDWADSTIFIVGNTEVWVRKEWVFSVNASGHDHPQERPGIANWLYRFWYADNPSQQAFFGRAGVWVTGATPATLADVVTFSVEYLFQDINGDSVFANPPFWHNMGFDCTLKGRDIETGEEFEQWVGDVRFNSYNAAAVAHETEERQRRFYLRLER